MSFLSKHQTLSVLVFFAILIAVFYGNTLANGFMFEDIATIESNQFLRSLEYLPKVITGCLQEFVDGGCGVTPYPYYRPVQSFTHLITYQISSQPFFFHLLHLVYFASAVSLVFLAIRRLTKNFLTAFFSSLFIIVNPLNSSVVNWISAGSDLQLVIFISLAILFYLRFREKKPYPTRVPHEIKQLLPVYIFYFLALLTKEHALFIPSVLACIDVFFLHIPIRSFLRAREWPRYLLFLVPTALYFFMKVFVMGAVLGGSAAQFSFWEGIHARVTLFAQYVGKVILPYPLSIFYPFEKSTDFASFGFIASSAVLIIFLVSIVYALKRRENIISFSLIWFGMFLFPVIVFLVGEPEHMLSERFAFLAGIGFSFIIGHIFSLFLLSYPKSRYIIVGALAIFTIASWLVVFPRNYDWKSEETMYVKTLQQYTDAHEVRRKLAEIYFQQGSLDLAKTEYEYLISHAQDWKDITMAYKGLGDYWRVQGDLDKALEYYIQSTQTSHMQSRDFVPFNDAGIIYLEHKQDPLTALTYFCQSLSLFPTEQTQQNFDKSLSLVQETPPSSITETFSPAPSPNIKYLDTRCQDESCQHAMALNPQNRDVILPMLLSASDSRSRPVEITNQSFDPQQSVIILETDAKYEDEDLTFVLPTCSRTYYEATTRK